MMNRTNCITVLMVLALVLCLGTGLALAAGAKVVPVEGIADFIVDEGVRANLLKFQGAYVGLYLVSGQTVKGYVKNVGKNMVQLTELENKEFFDAVVSIDDIAGFDVKMRKFENDKNPRVLK